MLRFSGIQDLAIELVSHKVGKDARKVRSNIWPRTLIIGCDSIFSDECLESMCSSRYSWLQEHVEKFICAIPGTAIDPRTCSSLLSRFNRLCDFKFAYGRVELDAGGSSFDLKRYVIHHMNTFLLATRALHSMMSCC